MRKILVFGSPFLFSSSFSHRLHIDNTPANARRNAAGLSQTTAEREGKKKKSLIRPCSRLKQLDTSSFFLESCGTLPILPDENPTRLASAFKAVATVAR